MARFGRSFPVPRLRRSTAMVALTTIAVGVLSSVFSVQAPTISTTRSIVVSPAVNLNTLSIQAPTITTTSNINISVNLVTGLFILIQPNIHVEVITSKAQSIIVSTQVTPVGFTTDGNMSMMFIHDKNKPTGSMV